MLHCHLKFLRGCIGPQGHGEATVFAKLHPLRNVGHFRAGIDDGLTCGLSLCIGLACHCDRKMLLIRLGVGLKNRQVSLKPLDLFLCAVNRFREKLNEPILQHIPLSLVVSFQKF